MQPLQPYIGQSAAGLPSLLDRLEAEVDGDDSQIRAANRAE